MVADADLIIADKNIVVAEGIDPVFINNIGAAYPQKPIWGQCSMNVF